MAEGKDQTRPRPDRGAEPKVRCEVCMKEIPPSEAKSAEAEAYTLYFCGIECYDKWHEREQERERGS